MTAPKRDLRLRQPTTATAPATGLVHLPFSHPQRPSPAITTEATASNKPQALSPRALEKQAVRDPIDPTDPTGINTDLDPTGIDDSQLRHLAPALHRDEPPASERPPSLTAIQTQSTKRRSFLESLLARQQRRNPLRDHRAATQRILNPINHVPRPTPVRVDKRTHHPPGAEPGTGEVHTLLSLPEQRRSRQYSPTSPHVEHSPQLSSAGGSRTSIGLPPNQKRTSQLGSQVSLPRDMGDTEKPSSAGPDAPAKVHIPTSRFNTQERDLESQNPQAQSILGSNYGLNPSDQPSHPPRRVASQKSLKHIKSSQSLRSSVYRHQTTNSEAPPPIPPKFGPATDAPQNEDEGDIAEELAWGPSHPCFPHLNPHVPINSPEFQVTRVIRIKRDWMVVGDLAPTFSNIYPEILDPLVSEQEFRYLVQHINTTLVHAFDPFATSSWLDGVLGFLTGWFWEDFRPTGVKGKLRGLEAWIERWNREVGSRDGVKIISLRRTGYMNLDIQIPDPQVKVVGDEDEGQRPPGTAGTEVTGPMSLRKD